MKSRKLACSAVFGSLIALTCLTFSCNDSGSPSYGTDFNPNATATNVPGPVFQAGGQNALTGLGLGQQTLAQAATAIRNGESGSFYPSGNVAQSAATAVDASGISPESLLAVGATSAGAIPNSLTDFSRSPASSAGGSGSRSSGSGSGSVGSGGIGSLGDTRTRALTDPSKLGPNGDGSLSAANALGHSNGSDTQGTYAAGGAGGAGRRPGGGSIGDFGSGGNGDEVGGSHGNSVQDIRRDPASLAAQADAENAAKAAMGSHDPANYFSLLNPSDNLFKIVERRYVSKSKQWAIKEAQEVRQSVH